MPKLRTLRKASKKDKVAKPDTKLRGLGRFLWRYKYFSGVVVASLVALGLELGGWHSAAHWLLGSVAILSTLPLLKEMLADFRSGAYGIDILAITAIVSAVWLHEYWAAAIIVVMLTGGEALEDYAEHRAKSELSSLLKRAPQKATIIRGRRTLEVPVSQVTTGDKIILKPGELVPVDAEILEGTGNFDEAALTGESLPVPKEAGDTLLSGSINTDGAITARALHSAKDSQYEQIVKMVRAASNAQAPFVRLADRYSIPFTLLAYAIAGTVWFISGDPKRFLEVIVVATPCPLLLAAPIAIISGMSRSAKHGIIVKTGGALERLAAAKTIAFDKTGTLTLGQLKVENVQALKPFNKAEVLAAAAGLEQSSNHAVAAAILSAAREQKLAIAKVKQLKETAGQGLAATVKGRQVLVGRVSFLEDGGVDVPKANRAGQTATYVAIHGQLAGVITFSDTVRPEAKDTLAALRKMGYKHLHMVTGDNLANAKSVATAVGISRQYVTAQALPADKLHAVEQAANRPVVFVGDGVNDAPVLTASDVGIALGARGSTVASESADVVILLDDLSRVAQAAAISKRTFRIAMQSIFIGMALSLGLMLVYATGKFSPLSGAIAQEAVDVFVIFNALRAHF
jgi:heavy metal translocating P-type ATPase